MELVYLEGLDLLANAFLHKDDRLANLHPHQQRDDEQHGPEEKQAHQGNGSIEEGFEEHHAMFYGAKIKKNFLCPFSLMRRNRRIKADIKGLPHMAGAPPPCRP